MKDETTRRDAVERAYRDHADDVYRVAYALLRDPEAAVDVTQDAFARAFERWDRYDPERPLRPWLQAIGANLARDALRRRRVRHLALPEMAQRRSGAGRDPREGLDPAETASRRSVAEAALDMLEPRARAALVLRHYHGYDHAAIAEILGTNAGTVGSLLSRSHAFLRAHLAEHEQPEGSSSGADRARRTAR